MASDIKEAIRRMIYQYVVEGADKVMATQQAVAASTTQTDKASLSLDKTFDNLERRYVVTRRAQEDYQKVQEKVNAAVAQNPELQERANAVLAEAGKHFDNLASRGNFFSEIMVKGFTKFLGPMALVNLALTAIGAAVGYMVAQWQSSSTTVEQAMEEQNRLMKESLKLIDAKTSAQDRMFAQSKAVTELQMQQNLLDLQNKLNTAMEQAIKLAERKATTPTQVAGEMGEAPTGVAPLGPGYDKIADAAQRLKDAWAAGLPGLQTYNDELAKAAKEYPELAAEINKLIQANQQNGIATEQAVLKTRAMSDALKGIATDAQAAAVGLGSVAQIQFNDIKAKETAAAAERITQEGLKLLQIYPGVSSETAKQLALLDAQLQVAKARTDEERAIATEKAKVLQLTLAGTKGEEAALIASKERRNAEEQQAAQQQTAASAHESYISRVNAMLAEHNAILDAANKQADELARTWERIPGIWIDIIDNLTSAEVVLRNIGQIKLWTDPNTGQKVQFNPEGYTSTYDPLWAYQQKLGLENTYGAANVEPVMAGGVVVGYRPKADYLNKQAPTDDRTAAEKLKDKLTELTDKLAGLTTSTDSLDNTMQNALSPFYSQDPRTTHLGFRAGVVGNPDWLAPGASNADPLAAILGSGATAPADRWVSVPGVRATAPGMAGGGSFVVGGGYSANDNRIAAFPVASGEQVVVNRSRDGGGARVVNIDNRTIITGTVDADALSKLKVSKYQQAQRMRAGLAQAS